MGPAGAGKTTMGIALAARLGTTFVDLDDVAGPWYAEVGWSVPRLVERSREVGWLAVPGLEVGDTRVWCLTRGRTPGCGG
ncbi:shikimate kinase [Demequina sediminicola]|uniref:shikimate kinase n=1 Tax=Demequina sediminicola TaxID=1095026 RepID=UPI003F71CAD9